MSEITITASHARELTDRIRTGVEAIWELVKQAYQSRAWSVLGYESWDDYCTREFGTSRIRLPREERQEVVSSMREIGMSPAAIEQATGVSRRTVNREISQWANAHPEKELPPVTGTDGKTYTPKPREPEPAPAPGISPAEVAELNNPQLDRVDPELEARVKAMSSAPGTGKHISATSAAERNETRYSAQITAREIISKQKELIALLANVGGFNGMDNYLQIMQENHDTIREMSQTGGIDAELNNLIGGK